ncbi:MAG: RecX family transcriptional regulator [Acetobacteraceae bacterium]
MSVRKLRPAPASSPPDARQLHEAALAYLARFAATQAGLRRVLERRIARWARAAEAEHRTEIAAEGARAARAAIEPIVARLAAAGAVDDAAFAAARARRLTRAGKSRVATAAHLAAKGVDAATAAAALGSDPEAEFAAALKLAARRRIGPFRTGEMPDAAGRLRELAVLARAGFPREVAERALRLDRAEAEARVIELRG